MTAAIGGPAHAPGVLRLLLGGEWRPGEGEPDWVALARFGRRNHVLIRLAERVVESGSRPAESFVAAVDGERQRVAGLIEVIGAVAAACAAAGIDHVFPKAFQHHPDMGGDVDLLVGSRSPAVDGEILAALPAVAVRPGLPNRIAGATTYHVGGRRVPLDIHHGRLGLLGEHTAYPAQLVSRRRLVEVGGVSVYVPAREDQLVLQGMQRVYGRLSIRLSDILAAVGLVREEGLDWDYVLRVARASGVLPGLGCYLAYVEQVHEPILGPLGLPPEARRQLALDGWGRVELRSDLYRFPAARVCGRLYASRLGSALASGEWDVARRLCLIPVVAAATVAQKVAR